MRVVHGTFVSKWGLDIACNRHITYNTGCFRLARKDLLIASVRFGGVPPVPPL